MRKGQLSIELFFALLLFVVLFLWMMNYAGVLSESLGEASLRAMAKAVASSIAITSNSACLHRVNSSFQLPCISKSGLRRPLLLSVSNSTNLIVSIPGESVHATTTAACPVTASLSSLCTGRDGDWICMKPARGEVSISKGRC